MTVMVEGLMMRKGCSTNRGLRYHAFADIVAAAVRVVDVAIVVAIVIIAMVVVFVLL